MYIYIYIYIRGALEFLDLGSLLRDSGKRGDGAIV